MATEECLGLPAGSCEETVIDIFQETYEVVEIMILCSTQWRTSGNGPVGLDYNVVIRIVEEKKNLDLIQALKDIKIFEQKILDSWRDSHGRQV